MTVARSALSTEHSGALLNALFEQSPVGLALHDTDLRFVWINQALAEINGVPAEDHAGRRIEEVLPDLREVHEILVGVVETGEPVVDVQVRGATPATSGRQRVWRASYFPLRDADGATSGVAAIVTEITEEHRAVEAQQHLQAMVARQSAILSEIVARVPVGIALLWGPEYRFELVNKLLEESLPDRGEVLGKTVAEVFPEHAEPLRKLYDPVRLTGEPLVLEDYAVGFADDPQSVRYYTSTAVRIAGEGEEDSGVLTVFRETTDTVRRRQELEVELEEERRIAHVLQESMRPRTLPEVPGVELASKFQPAGRRYDVGGDFYDVFEAPEGAWLLVLGDVCGKGAEAAGVTSLARHTLRTAGLFTGEPPALLAILNESMLRAELDMRFLTAVCARLDIARGVTRLAISSAGHCLPLHVRPDGSVSEVGGKGALLGVTTVPACDVEEVELEPGDTVVFFTDGVSDAAAPARTLEGEELNAVLSAAAGLPPAEMLARLETAALPPEAGEPRDDIAMLALRRPAAAG